MYWRLVTCKQPINFTAYCFPGQACRFRVLGKLTHQFASPIAAEEHYKLAIPDRLQSPQQSTPHQRSVSTPLTAPVSSGASRGQHEVPGVTNTPRAFKSTAPPEIPQNTASKSDAIKSCQGTLAPFHPKEQLDILSYLFSEVAADTIHEPNVPTDFLRLAVDAMHNLHTSGRSNTLYLLAKSLGTMRADNSDSLLPVTRMPMGLIEYAVAFFSASSIQQVRCAWHLITVKSVCVYIESYLYIYHPVLF